MPRRLEVYGIPKKPDDRRSEGLEVTESSLAAYRSGTIRININNTLEKGVPTYTQPRKFTGEHSTSWYQNCGLYIISG